MIVLSKMFKKTFVGPVFLKIYNPVKMSMMIQFIFSIKYFWIWNWWGFQLTSSLLSIGTVSLWNRVRRIITNHRVVKRVINSCSFLKCCQQVLVGILTIALQKLLFKKTKAILLLVLSDCFLAMISIYLWLTENSFSPAACELVFILFIDQYSLQCSKRLI